MKLRCMNCMKEYDKEYDSCPFCDFVKGTPPEEIYHLYPETMLADRYMIGTVIAYGGFGILYRAWDQKLQIMIAIKEHFPSNYVNRNPGETEIFIYTSKKQGEFEAGLTTFLEEARNTAKFATHPNIVNVYDYFKENGTAYMVMEYMEGVTLKQEIKEHGGKISWERAVEVISSICDDLHVVHEAGIIHRDISPDNIMICSDGTIKLFDFGAARFSENEREMTRTVILKIGFAPPEQYRAKSKQGPWTDIYALGATLYRAITGRLPDESVNRVEGISKEGKDTLVKPKELTDDIPGYLDIAIMKAMAVQSELRFKNVLQLKDALQNKKQYIDIEAELSRLKKRRTVGIVVLAISLFIAIYGCFSYYQDRKQETTLQDVTISVWVMADTMSEVEETEQMMQAMLEEFCSDYPKAVVDIACIPQAEYEERLRKASSTDEFPMLYESGILGDEFRNRQEDMSNILGLLKLEDYYFLDHITKEGTLYSLPIGINLPVLYGNTSLVSEKQKSGKENDKENFLSGKQTFWVGDTNAYTEVQEKLPGIYTIESVEQDELIIGQGKTWSIDNQASSLEKIGAKRLLYYFLGENAQDVIHLQFGTDLPLNKKEFTIYLDVNQEFSFLEKQVLSEKPMQLLEDEEYQLALNRIYQAIMEEDLLKGVEMD